MSLETIDGDCLRFERELAHFQADELPADRRRPLESHLEQCESCARRLALDTSLIGAVRDRLRDVQMPAGLSERIEAALADEDAARRGARPLTWVGAIAASLLLALALGSGVNGLARPGTGVAIEVDRELLVVDLPCDRAGVPIERQHRCPNPRHLNGFRVAPDSYWSLHTGQPLARRIATDPTLRGTTLRVRGRLLGDAGVLDLDAVEGLDDTRLRARFAPPLSRRAGEPAARFAFAALR